MKKTSLLLLAAATMALFVGCGDSESAGTGGDSGASGTSGTGGTSGTSGTGGASGTSGTGGASGASGASGAGGSSPELSIIDNPYRDVEWDSWQHHKANFHTHTTESDGNLTPAAVIDRYHDSGYTVLALTDHNKNTWPWTSWDRDPEDLGMIAVSGNEFSNGHHLAGLFNTRTGSVSSNERTVLDAIDEDGGLALLHHPGRYSRGTQWYVDLYGEYDILVGLEVYNQGDRYSADRDTWDEILEELMPDRPVWGYSNDDMHSTSHLFRNYNFMLIPSLTEANVRAAVLKGQSYFSYEPGGSGEAKAPRIHSIETQGDTITLSATNYTEINWIAGGTILANGETLDVAQIVEGIPVNYVRAQIVNEFGRTYTQPFGVRPSLGED